MNEVDTRIVQMQFDNSSFENGVKTSLTSLEQLKKGLELDKAVRSIQELENTFNGFSLEPLSNAVSELSDRFSTLGLIGMEAIQNITDRVVDFGASFAKNMVFGNAISGFQKYEAEMEAVQAMQSATNLSVAEIGKTLETLQGYCDETSYSYSDMTRTMSHFVKTSLTLDQSEKAVEGIANACADAGIGIRQADRAFEVFSKAMQMGHLGRNQYDSLHLMNFTTNKFNELLIETAKEVGTIDAKTGKIAKTIDGTAKKAKGEVVTLSNLDQHLHSGIINSEVLYKVLAKYQDQSTEFGAKAYAAAQNAKTFTDVVDSVKDAISTGWKDTYKNIFGDLDLARKRWTDIANYTIELVGEVAEYRNEITEPLNSLGVPGNIIRSYYYFGMTLKDLAHNAADAVSKIFPFFGDKDYNRAPTKGGKWGVYSPDGSVTADDMYPSGTPQKIADITKKIEKTFSDFNVFIKSNRENITNIIGGIVTKFALVSQATGAVWTRVKLIGSKFKPLFRPVLNLLGQIGKLMMNFNKYIRDNKIFHGFTEKFETAFKPITDFIPKAVEWVTNLTNKFKEVNDVLDQNGGKLWMIDSPIARILEGLISLWDILTDIGAFINNVFAQVLAAILPYAADFCAWIIDMAGSLGEWITKVNESGAITETLQKWSDKVGEVIQTLKNWANVAYEWVSSTGIIEAIKNKFNSFNRWLTRMIYGRTEAQQLAAEQLKELNKEANNGNVNLTNRPTVTYEYLRKRGWDVPEGDGMETLMASTYTKKFGQRTITFGITPIMPDGRVFNPRGLNNYIEKLVNMKDWDKALAFDRSKEGKGILLPWVEVPEGGDPAKSEEKISALLASVNELQGELYSVATETDDSLEVMDQFAQHTEQQATGVGAIQKALDHLHETLTKLANWFNTHSIGQLISDFFGFTGNFFSTTFDKIGKFFTADTSGQEGLTNKLVARIGAMKDIAEDGTEIPSILNTVLTLIQNIVTSLGSFGASLGGDLTGGKPLGEFVKEKVKWIAELIGGFFRGLIDGFTKDLNPLKFGNWKRGIEFFNMLLQALTYARDTLELPSTLSGMLEDLNTKLTGGEGYYTVRLQRIAGSILAVGLGVAAIAWAVSKLASIDWTGIKLDENGKFKLDEGSGLIGGIGALSIILLELEKFLEAIGDNKKLDSGKHSIFGVFSMYSGAIDLILKMAAIAGTVASLANSVKILSEIKFIDSPGNLDGGDTKGGLVSGLTGLTIILGELYGFLEISKELDVLGGAKGIVGGFTAASKLKAIGKTVRDLAESIKILSDIELTTAQFVTDEKGNFDWSKSLTSLTNTKGLVTGIAGLFFVLKALSDFIKDTGDATLLGNTRWGTFKLGAIATSVWSLAHSVKILSGIELTTAEFVTDEEGNFDWAKTATSITQTKGLVTGIAGLFFVLEALHQFIKNTAYKEILGDTKWGTFKLGAISDAVLSLTYSVKTLSEIELTTAELVTDEEGNFDWAKSITSLAKTKGLVTGIGGLFFVLEALSNFMKESGDVRLLGDTKWGTFKLGALSASVWGLVQSVKVLSEIPAMDIPLNEKGEFDITKKGSSLVSGMGALFILLEGLVAIEAQFNGLDKVSGKQSFGKTFLGIVKRVELIEIAQAVSMLVDATSKLAKLGPMDGAIAAIGTIAEGGMLYMLSKLLTGISDLTVQGAFASVLESGKFIVMAKGLDILSGALVKLGSLGWEQLGSGLGTMVGAMVAAGGGAEFFKNIKFTDIGHVLLDIGTFVTGFTGLFTGLGALIDFIENEVNKNVQEGDKLFSVEETLDKFSRVMGKLGSIIGSFFGGIVGGFLGAKDEAQNVQKNLSTDDIIASLTKMGETAEAIPFDELEKLENHIQKLKELGGSLIWDNGDHLKVDAATPIEELATQLQSLSDALERLGGIFSGTVDVSYLTKLQAVSGVMNDLVSMGSKIYTETGGDNQQIDNWTWGVQKFFSDIGANAYTIGEVAGNLAAQFAISFNNAMNSQGQNTYVAGQSVATQAKDGARSVYNDFYTAGQFLVWGLIIGINSMAGELSAAMTNLMTASAVTPAGDAVELGSPSKVFARIGAFMAEGLVVGLQSRTSVVEDASAAMAIAAIQATDSATNLEDIFANTNGTPVIRPILDLGDIRTGADTINGMLDRTSLATRDMDFSRVFEAPSVNVEGNGAMLAAINSINERLDNLGNAVTNMSIVLDTGVMVGSMSRSIDEQLGKRTIMRERGA